MPTIDDLLKKHGPRDTIVMQAELAEIFETCFNTHPDLVVLGIVGHTPSFNDGDICEHSDEAFVLTKDTYYGGSWRVDSAIERLDEDDEDIGQTIYIGSDPATVTFPSTVDMKAVVANGTNKRNKAYDQVIELLYTQRLTEDMHGTNYVVWAYRDPNPDGNSKIIVRDADYWDDY